MINVLLKAFVKDYNDTKNGKVRERYGVLTSIVGILCNTLLFVIKYIMGTLSNSIAIISDGFNNLSDCASSVVTLFGYKMAAKPADKDHPFGHGRIEYLTSLVIAVVILVVGVELMTESIGKIQHPETVQFNWMALAALVFSMLLKLWMAYFNRNLGKRIDSSIMMATARDSLNDVIATAATVISLVGSLFTSWPLDGIMGVIVSLFILLGGFDIVRDTVDELLGQPLDHNVVEAIEKLVYSREEILGMHDLIVHSYGPGKQFGSAHVEVSSTRDFIIIHDIVDEIEKKINQETNIKMTLHMDPIETENEIVNEYREKVANIVSSIDESLSIHDFRVVIGPTHTNLIFDVQVPYECKSKNKDIKKAIDSALYDGKNKWYTVITFDKTYY